MFLQNSLHLESWLYELFRVKILLILHPEKAFLLSGKKLVAFLTQIFFIVVLAKAPSSILLIV